MCTGFTVYGSPHSSSRIVIFLPFGVGQKYRSSMLLRRRDGQLPLDDRVAIVLVTHAVHHPIEIGHALVRDRDLPRLRKRDGILDRELVLELVLADHTQALGEARLIADHGRKTTGPNR